MKVYFQVIVASVIALNLSAVAQEQSGHWAGKATIVESGNLSNFVVSSDIKFPDRLQIVNKSIYEIISGAYPGYLPIIDDAKLNNARYNVTIPGTNADDGDYWKSLQEALLEKFQIVETLEKRKIDIYEIRAPRTLPPGLTKSKPSDERRDHWKNNRRELTKYSMDDLEYELNKVLPLPVYNETGLTNDYNFTLEIGSEFSAIKTVESVKKLGLSLEKTNKEEEVLVIKKSVDLVIPK